MTIYKKTAKDLAFDKKQEKLKSEINKLNLDLRMVNKELLEKEVEINHLREENERLLKAFDALSESKFTPDQLLEHIKQTKKINDLFSMMDSTYSKYLKHML